MYSNKNNRVLFGKDAWGPPKWKQLHLCAINYPDYPTHDEITKKYQEIMRIIQELPCPECRGHALKYIRNDPPNLINSQTLQIWVWDFHNRVNARLKKPFFNYSEYERMYDPYFRRTGRRNA